MKSPLLQKIASIALILLCITTASCGVRPGESSETTGDPSWLDPEITRVSAPGFDETTVPPQTAATDAPVTTAPKPTENRVSFIAAGDNIIHENVYTDAKNRAKSGEKYDFVSMYADIADFIKAADLAFVNQETPVGSDELGISGYPNFNGPSAAGEALVEVGFDIVNIATNHMLDKKSAGYQGALDFWATQPVTLVGGYYNKEDYENIRVVEKNGISIAFVSYTYGLNGMTLDAGSELYVPIIDENEIVRMVEKAEKIADMTFVVMHWGPEGTGRAVAVDSTQKSLAKAITNAGADVILGMHSHTLQPIEWQTGKDGNKTLVIYSLGNFLNSQYDSINLVGGIVGFDIVKSNGNISIENVILNPVVVHYDGNRLGFQLYLLEDYTKELAAAHGTVYYGGLKTFTLDTAMGFVTSQISDEFLPDFMK